MLQIDTLLFTPVTDAQKRRYWNCPLWIWNRRLLTCPN